jgi:hypothetical protein
MTTVASGENGNRAAAETACAPLGHPTRVRLLEVANERAISPIQFVHTYVRPKPKDAEAEKRALSHVSYHFRFLHKAGCVEIVDRIPRRGSMENVYRASEGIFFTSEEAAAMSPRERRRASRTILQGLLARAEVAIQVDTIDRRHDAHMTWNSLRLDERGWSELTTLLDRTFDAAELIRRESEARLDESGEEPVHATYGLLGFESPPARAGGDG